MSTYRYDCLDEVKYRVQEIHELKPGELDEKQMEEIAEKLFDSECLNEAANCFIDECLDELGLLDPPLERHARECVAQYVHVQHCERLEEHVDSYGSANELDDIAPQDLLRRCRELMQTMCAG